MDALTNLLVLYAGVVLINVLLSAFLWRKQKAQLQRSLLFAWLSMMFSLVAQGALQKGAFLITLGFSSVFLVNLALSRLLGEIVALRPTWKGPAVALSASLAFAFASERLGAPFWVVALPAAVAVTLPLLTTGVRALRLRSDRLSASGKALLYSCFFFCLHNIDFAFLRDKPEMAAPAFTVALLVAFALSVTTHTVVHESVALDRARVVEMNQFQRQFFANITHELRTPLTMILAPLDSLLSGHCGPLTATQRSYLESNQRNAIRLLKLINDLLDLAKMEEGFLRLRLERTDMQAMLEQVVEYARPLAARKKLSINLVVKVNPEPLETDAEKIERVVINLISNALKFTSEGGVTLTLEEEVGQLKLTVADSGIGISREALPHIFERFSQGDGSVTRRYGGTGIGLAYAKQIVELHGGRIVADSTPGKGSQFIVYLRLGADVVPEQVRDRRVGGSSPNRPKRQDDQEPVEWALRLQRQLDYRFAEIDQVTNRRLVSRTDAAPTTTGRILVVEDNLEILELINLQLREKYTVFAAQDGRQGLEIARRERPDAIVTDFMMPEMDGLTMLKAIREEPGMTDVPVIMLTAKNQLEDRLSARQAGADVYLEKPFSPRELEAAITQLLQKLGRQVQNLMRAHVEGLEIVSAGLAHEIHNPLNFIKNANLLIAENVGKLQATLSSLTGVPPERTGAIDKIRERIDKMVQSSTRGVERIEKVVDLIRRYAREGYPTEPSEVDFDLAVAEVTELVAPRADMEGRVTEALGAPGRIVRAIPEELNQVIRSLVQNACESVGPSGKVHVTTRVEGAQVVLEVTDNGPGISPENVAKIFSPFFTTKPGSGRGMGLAIVQIVINRIGGSVEVTSTPGVQTMFRVRLPATEGTVQPQAQAAPAGSTAAPLN